MRTADIRAAIAANPSDTFAARVLIPGRYSYQDEKKVVPVTVVKVGPRITVKVPAEYTLPRYEGLGENEVKVQPAAILERWETHVFNRDHDAALSIDRQRDERIAYDRQRAEHAAWIESWVGVFDAVSVPPTGSANIERDDVNLGEMLRDYFIKDGASATMFGPEHFERIAIRLAQLEVQVLESSSGWGTSGQHDDGIARVNPIDKLAALAASAED